MKSAKAILVCGKLCCGKSFYTEKLRKERGAAVLSCDELMLRLLPPQLGELHNEVSKRAQGYLLDKAAELLALGVPVILEWGFWTRASRQAAEKFFRGRGVETEWHHIHVDDETWARLIKKRNGSGNADSYFVDENLLSKCTSLFEEPTREEIDVWYNNEWCPQ